MGQAKNLAKGWDGPGQLKFRTGQAGTGRDSQNSGRDGPGQPKSRTGRAGTAKNRDGTWDKTGQSKKGHSETEKGCSKTENNVLKQERMF